MMEISQNTIDPSHPLFKVTGTHTDWSAT